MVILWVVTFFGGLAVFILGLINQDSWPHLIIWAGAISITIPWFLIPGFFILQPNEARVLVLFGKYRGTVRKAG